MDEMYTVEQARAELGLTKNGMARAIREGKIHTEPHPFDRRIKLIRREEIERYKTLPRPKPRPKKLPVAA